MNSTYLRVFLPADQIHARIQEMGARIGKDYSTDHPLVMICILKGACIFLADLIRAIPRDVRIEFMGISSYGKQKSSSGEVRVMKDLDASIEGADILIVEDILDTGITLTYLKHVLAQRNPRTLEIVTLLDKPERRQRPVDVKYVGFQIPDEFVVGYGLDYAEKYRNLKDICILEQ